MTSFAFILGVVPLVLAKGAGAEMRVALGVAVFSGMLGVTVFGLFFTPVFYSLVMWFADRGKPARSPAAGQEEAHGHKLSFLRSAGERICGRSASRHARPLAVFRANLNRVGYCARTAALGIIVPK